MNLVVSPQEAATELLRRRAIRRSFTDWCQYKGFEPAAHHQLIIDEIASEEKREELATQKFLSEQETERMKILERAYYLKSRSVRQVHNRHLRPAG